MDFDEAYQWLKHLWEERGPSTWVVVAVSIVYVWYKYESWNFGIFKKMGVKGPKPWPFLGTGGELYKGFLLHDVDMKKRYGKLVGTFLGRRPLLLVYDPEIVKAFTIKEFSSFSDRNVPPMTEYPMSKMLTLLKGDHWRHVRNTLTPTFSSGKLRKMQHQIAECTKTFVANLQQKADSGEIFDYQELCSALSMDVIARTAFSIQIDSHNDPNNQFVKMSHKCFDALQSNRMFFIFLYPYLIKVFKFFGVSFFPRDATEFFTKAVELAIEQRRESAEDQNRVDFLRLMLNAEDEHVEHENDHVTNIYGGISKAGGSVGWSQKGLTHEEVLAQGILFLLGGFETTAGLMGFLGYTLATNPECQDKLLAEIDKVLPGETPVTYDNVNQLTYLDMCISETLRLFPGAARLDRVALNDITINGLFIPKGMIMACSIWTLHRDPEYWNEPEKFDPDRFTPEAKAARNPYVYMPFGMGPRNCIGMRLALMEVKMATVHILRQFKFVACEETENPVVMERIRMRAANGIKLRIKSRAA